MYRTQLTGFLLVLLALVSANVVGAETEAQAAGQELTTAKVELLIDKAKYYSFEVQDILQAQSNIDLLEAASNDAAEGMRVAVETDVLSGVVISGC